ncbi:MAG: GGDEF/EAL domain-containing response regulator [Gammaproteobacteria bacterium]
MAPKRDHALGREAQLSDGNHATAAQSSGQVICPEGHPVATLTDGTIMLIDDEPLTLEVVQTFLEEAGYTRFVTTDEPRQAIELLASRRPDIVLLDLMMPEVSGFDILSRMRADTEMKYTPVIVLTSANDAATKLKALELGATDFLSKPVDPSELTLRLRNALAFKAYQDRLANYDDLTGLPNRRMFLARLDWAIRRATRHRSICALLHVDLDRFRQINDSFGHRVGDSLLRAVAQRLEDSVRDSDAVGCFADEAYRSSLSRIGGDEFTVLVSEIGQAENASLVARRISAALAKPFLAEERDLFLTASIGIAAYPGDGVEPDSLLQHAEVAMHYSKSHGGNSYEFYSKEINARASERLTLENQLRRALEREELLLHYQPKVDVGGGHIVGAEALVRWQHPELGLVSPAQFVPLAEESGLIVPIGEWVLREACKECKAWQHWGPRPLGIAVNVSSVPFKKGGLLQVLRSALETSGLEASQLVIELTESVLMESAAANIRMLQELKAVGVRLAIDDFGTGYSSLSYLKRFPLDELKIDRSFMSDIPSDRDNAAIASAIIAMAHTLGLKVVAEGIETGDQLEFLKAKLCDEFQGYLFSRPLPKEELKRLLLCSTAGFDSGLAGENIEALSK